MELYKIIIDTVHSPSSFQDIIRLCIAFSEDDIQEIMCTQFTTGSKAVEVVDVLRKLADKIEFIDSRIGGNISCST